MRTACGTWLIVTVLLGCGADTRGLGDAGTREDVMEASSSDAGAPDPERLADASSGPTHEPIDAARDGGTGARCDDENGAVEVCNEVDDDCDGSVDEGACPARDCGSVDTWRPTSTVGAPSPRAGHRAVWTGTEMMVWGGGSSSRLVTGGLYDPAADTWRTTPPAPIAGRNNHVMVWTGSEVLIWGGWGGLGDLRDGAAFDPATMSWRSLSTVDAPPATAEPQGVWTGTELLVWGDETVEGGRYDPVADRWTPMSTAGAPALRDAFVMVSTGDQVLVWGGRACSEDGCPYVNTGGRYDLSSDRWSVSSTAGAPTGTSDASGVWTGDELIVFGGRTCGMVGACNSDDGGRYDPVTDTWSSLSPVGRPSARFRHAGLWTGARMLVWGGWPLGWSDGAIYDPAADRWTAMSTVDQPEGRYGFTAVWTGTEMIVWGGNTTGSDGATDDGGVYCPARD
jgi:hypothetical protein